LLHGPDNIWPTPLIKSCISAKNSFGAFVTF
jgi:hypothetical protein